MVKDPYNGERRPTYDIRQYTNDELRAMAELKESVKKEEEKRIKCQQHYVDLIQSKWKAGDRFVMSQEADHKGQSGFFLGVFGPLTFRYLRVEWDNGYWPKYVGQKVYLKDFWLNARKVEGDGE